MGLKSGWSVQHPLSLRIPSPRAIFNHAQTKEVHGPRVQGLRIMRTGKPGQDVTAEGIITRLSELDLLDLANQSKEPRPHYVLDPLGPESLKAHKSFIIHVLGSR